MYLYISTLRPEDEKWAFAAIDIAVECGVNRQYAEQVMQSGDIDMVDANSYTAMSAAGGIMHQYEGQYSSPERPNLVNWALYRQMRQKG